MPMTAVALPLTAGSQTSRRVSAGSGAAWASMIFCRTMARNWLSIKDDFTGFYLFYKDIFGAGRCPTYHGMASARPSLDRKSVV